MEALQAAVNENPNDDLARAALADCHEEQGQLLEAMLVRLRDPLGMGDLFLIQGRDDLARACQWLHHCEPLTCHAVDLPGRTGYFWTTSYVPGRDKAFPPSALRPYMTTKDWELFESPQMARRAIWEALRRMEEATR